MSCYVYHLIVLDVMLCNTTPYIISCDVDFLTLILLIFFLSKFAISIHFFISFFFPHNKYTEIFYLNSRFIWFRTLFYQMFQLITIAIFILILKFPFLCLSLFTFLIVFCFYFIFGRLVGQDRDLIPPLEVKAPRTPSLQENQHHQS